MKIRKDVKIGIFALVVALLLYWGVNFLKGKDFFTSNVTYYTTSAEIGDLSDAASVFIKGVRVGTVTRIAYNPEVSSDVVVKMQVDPRYRIPKDTRAVLFTNGLMGGRAIRLDLGVSQEYCMAGDTLASAVDKGLLDMSGEEIEHIKGNVLGLIDNMNTTLLSLNGLLTENSDNIHSTIAHLNTLSRNLDNIVAGQKGRIDGTMANIHALSGSLRDDAVRFDRIVANVDSLACSLNRAGLPQLAGKLDDAATKVGSLLGKIDRGEGTLGKAVNDKALYDSLTRATSDLSALLQDIKEHPKRYVHVSVF
ncbi:MAG: MlaD family protein [Rikenellaceae bacterium]|jgi:phospholipid/cholesterol/gamma-HCH transport system substrate-binding protein|nr:MlaD family protein [Rikenellaceae bacterium]